MNFKLGSILLIVVILMAGSRQVMGHWQNKDKIPSGNGPYNPNPRQRF